MEITSSLKNKANTTKIQETTEEKETWIFKDTECQIDQRIYFQWNHLFQALFTGDY